MEELEIPEFLSSEFIQNVASNADIMKLVLDNENEDLIVKDGHFKVNDISKLSKLKLVLCDVKIQINNSECMESICKDTDSTQHKTSKTSGYRCTDSSHHNTYFNSRYKNKGTDRKPKLLFDIDGKDTNKNMYIGKQGKTSFDEIEGIKELLKQTKKSKVEIENLERELYKKNKTLKISQKLLRHEQKKKIAIQSKIEAISTILNHSHKSLENRLTALYKKEMTTLKNNLNIKDTQIKEIEKSLNENEQTVEKLRKIINKKTDKLFENLFNYNI